MTIPDLQFARRLAAVFAWLSLAIFPALGQADRIDGPVDVSKTKLLVGNRTPKALLQDDQGGLDLSQKISGITLVFKPSASEITDLDELLQEQRDSSSPNYRNWLTPEQYADRFGLSRNDLEKVISWLEAEGFSVDYVSRGRTWIMFNGPARQVLTAFHTEIHRYNVHGELHFANAADPSVPAALDPVVLLLRGLDDFRTEPRKLNAMPVANFTSSGGGHSLVPGDIATIYDIGPLYQRGITGSGQKVAVVGQTDIYLSDIEHFRSQYGLPVNNPEVVLVAGSPDPGVSEDDLIESSLDLEYAGGIAPNATIREGDALVVETIGFNDRTVLDLMGHPHSDALRVVERYHRRDFGHMDVEVTIDDPKMYTKPFSIKFTQNLLADSDVLENVCAENEKDVVHIGRN
jgi:biotin operon repressor